MLLSLVCSVVCARIGGAAAPPNLFWIMADDMGVGELHNPLIRLPSLESLSRESLRFSAAYAGYTVCAPSRTTFYTGRNSGHAGFGMPGDGPLLPRLLRAAGYETAVFGKSAPMDTVDAMDPLPQPLVWGQPLDFGFETFVGQESQLRCHNMYPVEIGRGRSRARLPLNEQPKSRERCMAHPER